MNTVSAVNTAATVEEQPLLHVRALTHHFGQRIACADVSFELFPGEVLAVVGESGSGKTTLLRCVSGQLKPASGEVCFRNRLQEWQDIWALPESARRMLARTDWGFVHQNPRDGLRLNVSAGANIGERLMAVGARHYGNIRGEADTWMRKVELDTSRIDDAPTAFSGGMQQRLQIARNLVTHPRVVFMDEPTGGLDVSVQAKLLDLLRSLTQQLGVAAIVVTHDLAVARLLAQRTLVMKAGTVIEQGLTDQVLDDPQQPYTQLLVSSALPA